MTDLGTLGGNSSGGLGHQRVGQIVGGATTAAPLDRPTPFAGTTA